MLFCHFFFFFFNCLWSHCSFSYHFEFNSAALASDRKSQELADFDLSDHNLIKCDFIPSLLHVVMWHILSFPVSLCGGFTKDIEVNIWLFFVGYSHAFITIFFSLVTHFITYRAALALASHPLLHPPSAECVWNVSLFLGLLRGQWRARDVSFIYASGDEARFGFTPSGSWSCSGRARSAPGPATGRFSRPTPIWVVGYTRVGDSAVLVMPRLIDWLMDSVASALQRSFLSHHGTEIIKLN